MQDVDAALHERSVIIVNIAASESIGCFVAIWEERKSGLGLEDIELSHALLKTRHGSVCPVGCKEVRGNSRVRGS
jgi:hypothetical protein